MVKSGYLNIWNVPILLDLETRRWWEQLCSVLAKNADVFLLSSNSLNPVPNSLFFKAFSYQDKQVLVGQAEEI